MLLTYNSTVTAIHALDLKQILHLSAGQCPAHMVLESAPCAPGTVLLKDEELRQSAFSQITSQHID